MAGQTELIGHVNVWNDADTLYVNFVSMGDCFLETHVAVGDELSDLPQTKKGNPIPGQFQYSDPHSCVQDYTYDIALDDWAVGTPLYIAAHAALGQEMSMTVASAADGKTTVYGPIYEGYAGPGAEEWQEEKPALSTFVADGWAGISGAEWISSYSDYPEAWTSEGFVPESWRWFHRELNVPGPVKEAKLTANADNAEEIWVNGTLGETDGEVQGAFTDDHEWEYVEGPDFVDIYEGTNALDFIVRNYPATSAGQRNPTALAYKLDVTYYEDGETAWAGEEPFEGKNWATYFTYTVCPAQYVLNIESVNNNTGYPHEYTIVYDPLTREIEGTGYGEQAGNESLSEFEYTLDDDGVITYIAFRSDYDDTSYYSRV